MEYIVEVATRDGPICERFATYEEAAARVDGLPADAVVGMPFIFRDLPDGSQRLVREDGKPLQWHRLEDDRDTPVPDEAIPLGDDLPEFTNHAGPAIRAVERPRDGEDEEDPIPIP